MFGEIARLGVPRGGFGVAVADHDGKGAMKANDQVPVPQVKLADGFRCRLPTTAVAGEPCCRQGLKMVKIVP
jgi:hypothetical protein